MEVFVLIGVSFDYHRFERLTMVSANKEDLIAHASKHSAWGFALKPGNTPDPIMQYPLEERADTDPNNHWWIYTQTI